MYGAIRAESYYLVIALCALVAVSARDDNGEARDSALVAYLFKVCNCLLYTSDAADE